MRELLGGPGADGGAGYFFKEKVGGVADFLRALDTVAGGGVVIDPEVVKHATGFGKQDSRLSRLTEREREVLMHMAEGHSNTEISGNLSFSAAAVSKHVSNVFLKFGFSSDEDNRRVKAILA